MARYEGMDELLQRVREHLDAAEPPASGSQAGPIPGFPSGEQPYESALENLLLIMHDAEQLRGRLTPGRVHAMSREQHDDLQSILNKVLQELYSCDAVLQRFRVPD